MPITQLKNIAKKSNKSLKTIEAYWNKAKEIAAKRGKKIKSKWGFITYLTKKMAGIAENKVEDFMLSDKNLTFENFWRKEEWLDEQYQKFLKESTISNSKSIEVLPNKIFNIDFDLFASNMSKIGFIVRELKQISDNEIQIKTETSTLIPEEEIFDSIVDQIKIIVVSDDNIPDYSNDISIERDTSDKLSTTYILKAKNGYKIAIINRERNWFLPG